MCYYNPLHRSRRFINQYFRLTDQNAKLFTRRDGYGTVPSARWAIDTEGGHVEIPYPECEMAMNTEGGHVVDSVSLPR